LSVKQCLGQKSLLLKILLSILLSWSIFSLIPLPAAANSLLAQKQSSSKTDRTACRMALAYECDLSLSKESDDFNIDSHRLTAQPAVFELSDVEPTDWAYQALRLLVKRYGVIVGNTNGTFALNRPLSRYEFAAVLAATLKKLEQSIVKDSNQQYTQQDAIVLQRLQKEYKSALEDLQQRVGNTETGVTQLQANQFSTTTKLQGEQIIALSDGTDAGKTVISRSRLTFSTSFNQKDFLVTQLESGNNGGDAIDLAQKQKSNLFGTTGLLVNGGGLDYVGVNFDFQLRRLYYTFRPWPDLALTVGAKMLPRDFIDRNRYADNEAVDFSSGFFLRNPLIVQNQIDRNGGAGAALLWNPGGGKWTLRSLYIAADANQANANTTVGGLFGDRYQTSVEIEYSPSERIAFRLQYTNALINNTTINALGINTEYAINNNTGIFGRLGFGSYNGYNTAVNKELDLHPVSWAVGFGFRNLLLPGTVAGVAVGQPFLSAGVGNATQTNLEAFYNLLLSDNLSITPVLSLVANPNNDNSKGTIWQTTLRSVFSF